MRICVFGAASPTIDPEYIQKVELLGEEMAKRGHSLVFGAGGNGLMGAAARGVHKGGGYVLGVIPKFFEEEGVEAIQFGRDVSGKVAVETELQKDANGNYVIPTDKEGVYTITYTVDAYKFQKGENGVIKRIRTFTVNAAEEDGRNG